MTRRALVLCAAILGGVILTPRPASAWWETQVVTNYIHTGYQGVDYASFNRTQYCAFEPPWSATALEVAIEADVDWDASSDNCVLWDNSITGTGTGTKAFCFRVESGGSICGLLNNKMNGSDSSSTFNPTWYTAVAATGGGVIRAGYRAVTGGYANYSYLNGVLVAAGPTNSALAFATTWYTGGYLGRAALSSSYGTFSGKLRRMDFYENGNRICHILPIIESGVVKLRDFDTATTYTTTGTLGYGEETGEIVFTYITTNRVYHANPPASAYDALSPWNAPERTRLGGDARTLRPSAQIVP